MSKKKYERLENLGVTRWQRDNLEKLYARTEGRSEDSFKMSSYSESSHPTDAEAAECGTVACLAGHGPKVGIPALPDEYWDQYVDRVYGESYELWQWLFDAGWERTDDTLAGGRARLRIALDRGVPSDASDQMTKRTPLEYATTPAA